MHTANDQRVREGGKEGGKVSTERKSRADREGKKKGGNSVGGDTCIERKAKGGREEYLDRQTKGGR